MKWIKVDSSNILALSLNGTVMSVQFTSGAIYQYDGVSEETFNQIKDAESVGSTFNRLIKKNPETHPYRKVA